MYVEIQKDSTNLFTRNQKVINSCTNYIQLENCQNLISLIEKTDKKVAEALKFIYNQKLMTLNNDYEES